MNWKFRYILKYVKFYYMKGTWKTVEMFYDYKSGALVPGHSAQKFNTQYHFGIFDPKIADVKWYDDEES